MNDEDLGERASRIAQETRRILETLYKSKSAFEERTLEAVRRMKCEEVERANQEVMEKAMQEMKKIVDYPVTYGNRVVWICASYAKPGIYHLSVSKMDKDRPEIGAAMLREKGYLYLPLEVFKSTINKLKNSILEGDLDEHLHLKAERLIYNKMIEAWNSLGFEEDPSVISFKEYLKDQSRAPEYMNLP